MIKAVIIDDLESYRKKLRLLIEKFLDGRVTVVDEASNITEGMAVILKHHPDLVFLDIEMPGGSGFDLLEKIGHINFDIIFTTAHSDFAIRAIKFSALDYILKPVDPDELLKAIQKHEEKKKHTDTNKQFEVLFQNLKNKQYQINFVDRR